MSFPVSTANRIGKRRISLAYAPRLWLRTTSIWVSPARSVVLSVLLRKKNSTCWLLLKSNQSHIGIQPFHGKRHGRCGEAGIETRASRLHPTFTPYATL